MFSIPGCFSIISCLNVLGKKNTAYLALPYFKLIKVTNVEVLHGGLSYNL
jgi:hypothetical protein